ncbi:MAG: PAS domain-containing protein [Gammaproteobacteria bacterium]|nr:PAS domain-containing protein [Gammaproteobacteria bacterium]NNM01574.1 PAS domain-containing protein [Gammaproteobacteria bacterium]
MAGPDAQALAPEPISAEELSDAFVSFERASAELGEFYSNLEAEVGLLSEQLRSANERREAELEEKQRVAARLSSLLEALPGGVIVLDANGSITQFNPAADTLVGKLSCGEAWRDVVARVVAPRWDDGHDVSLRDGRRVNIATQALSGEPGQILLIKDVTETRRLQEQLHQHKRLSSSTQMAAALAHQIRTPLAAALLHCSNLSGAGGSAPERSAARVRESLKTLETLVENMLTFARGRELDVERTSSAALIEALAQGVNALALPESFSVELPDDAPAVALAVNIESLVSALMNLVGNVRQVTDDHARVAVTCNEAAGMFEIAIRDDGPGIPDADQVQIFEPFFSTRARGTGLGLAVARSIALAHGGDLQLAESSASGTCFILELPVATANAQPIHSGETDR